jgi:ribosome biogenesis GTPase
MSLRYNLGMTQDQKHSILEGLGWDDFYEKAYKDIAKVGIIPARVTNQQKFSYQVMSVRGELEARLPGKMLQDNAGDTIRPAVGDWLAVTEEQTGQIVIIESVLPRKSRISRLTAGGRGRALGGPTQEQVVAANIDKAFIVSALDSGRGFNLRRIERYLTLAWSSGASPVIVLNKIDLCEQLDSVIAEVEEIGQGVPILTVSATEKQGIDQLKNQLARGVTVAFLGPSGVGKSSLINALLGYDRIKVNEVRADDSAGRHTTTQRELFLLPDGGAVIDTPGMREIQLWTDEESLDDTFSDIHEQAAGCRFRDCTHQSEPGCAVRDALSTGALDSERFNNYLKLQKELRFLAARQDGKVRIERTERWKKISQWQKQLKKNRP